MTLETALVVLGGALAGGFVNGLAGFGTGITALGLWLFVLSPVTAATLVVVCSAAAQVQTLPYIRHAIDMRRVLPFILPGLAGVPLGTALLADIDVATFKFGIGILLICYASYALYPRMRQAFSWGGAMADGTIGFFSGILGGLAGLSGPLATVWADLRGWPKDEKRGLFQAFNLSILSVALVLHVASGFATHDLFVASLIALPGTFFGAWLGRRLYAQMSDQNFTRTILILLVISGAGLIWTALSKA